MGCEDGIGLPTVSLTEKEAMSAQELSRRLSGHALGISHIAGLVHL